MTTQFNQIKAIVAKDKSTLERYLNKLFEEAGELASAVNNYTGTRIVEDLDGVHENVLEESADAIQCIFTILIKMGFSFQELVEKLEKKNQKWIEKYGLDL